MNISIYIATHKKYWFPNFDEYKPIHVGAVSSEEKFIGLCDSNEISISEKNKNYCELTALYWIWKNDISSEIIGLCHYRRYFFLKKTYTQLVAFYTDKYYEQYMLNFLVPQKIDRYLKEYDVILPKKNFLGLDMNLELQYCKMHRESDFCMMKRVLLELYPEYEDSLNAVIRMKWVYFYNMFIMKRELFNNYMEWLFHILFELEKRIEIPKDEYQARVFGFLAERLLNIYVFHNKLKVKEVPYIFIDDKSKNKIYTRKINIYYRIVKQLAKKIIFSLKR